MDFKSATEKLGRRDRRKLENNTYLERRPDGSIAIRLHQTDVLTFRKSGAIEVTSGGWRTPTTKDRINSYLGGYRIFQERGSWFWGDWSRGGRIPFTDGDRIYRGRVIAQAVKNPEKIVKAEQKLRREVREYARAFAEALPVAPPSGGDCWVCLAGASEPEHIREHIREKYFVPSLLAHALKAAGAGPAWGAACFGADVGGLLMSRYGRESVARFLTRYIYRQLGTVREAGK